MSIENQTIINLTANRTYFIYYKSSASTWRKTSTNSDAGKTITFTADDFTYTPYDNKFYIGCYTGISNWWYRLNDGTVTNENYNTTIKVENQNRHVSTTSFDLSLSNKLELGSEKSQFGEEPTPITINNTGVMTNCSISYTPETINQGEAITFTWSANSGYEFTTTPTITIDNTSKNATISNDKLTATIKLSKTDTENITSITTNDVTATLIYVPTIETQTISNLTTDRILYIVYKDSEAETGNWHIAKTIDSSKTEEVTNTDFTYNVYNYEYYIACSADILRIYYQLNDGEITSENTLDAIKVNDLTLHRTTITFNLNNINTLKIGTNETQFQTTITFVKGNLEYCDANATPDPIIRGNAVNIIWTVIDTTQYKFNTEPTAVITYVDEHEETLNASINTITYETANLQIIDTTNIAKITVSGVAVIKANYVTDFVTLYVPTRDELKSLSSKRFIEQKGSDGTTETIDLAQYITALRAVYYKITPSEGKQHIILGRTDTNVSSKVCTKLTQYYEMGYTHLTGKNGNSNDYNCDVQILLPFCGLFSLDPKKTINKTVSVLYTFSNLNGECVAEVRANGNTIDTFTGKGGIDIPYRIDNNFRTNFTLDTNTLYGGEIKIIVTYKDNYNSNNTALVSDEKYCKLSELTGLNYVDDVVVNGVTLSDDEVDMITNELRNGVIF